MKFFSLTALAISTLIGQSASSFISPPTSSNLDSQSSVYLDSANDSPIFDSPSSSQVPLQIELPFNPSEYDHLIKTVTSSKSNPKVSDIIAAQNGAHVHLTHTEFPDVKMRVKRVAPKKESRNTNGRIVWEELDPQAFCDTTVTSWSGYIDFIDGKSLFFFFFESRSSPDEDPLLFWTNGGPGCSGQLGLFQELGPCSVPEGSKGGFGVPINGTDFNPFSWNSKANLLVVDQPVGVGYSYSRYGVEVTNSNQAARDIYKFMRIFLDAFEDFRTNDFVLASESYGGRYMPRFATEIVDMNREKRLKAKAEGREPKAEELVNLKKVLIGNGLTDTATQTPYYYDFTCTNRGGSSPVLSIQTCKRMKYFKERCAEWLEAECRHTYDSHACQSANEICDNELMGPYFATGNNPYNIEDPCLAGLSPNLCYPVSADIRAYLDRDDVRSLVGAAPISEIGKFQTCSVDVAMAFNKAQDSNVDNSIYVEGLLERGIEVFIYVGELDWICNWLGNKAWVSKLQWTNSDAFHNARNYQWIVDGEEAGEAQQGGGLHWATIKKAGHMVPYDKPRAALEMLTRYLNGEKL